MSIQTEITRLQTAKGDMKTAIEGKGVTVPSAALVDDYPEYISQIGGAVDLSHRDVFGKITVAQNTANSYVVKTAGTYKIPLVYGNGIKNSAVNAAAYTRQGSTYTADFVNHLGNTLTSPYIEANAGCTPASVGLLWQTTAGMITSVDLVDGFKCKYLQFTVASVPTINGLAVLWVKDGNGDIMWSWTIWCTTDVLTPETFTNHDSVNYDMMPENLFAIWNAERTRYVSPYFQWGRKDVVGLAASYNVDRAMALYDISGNSVTMGVYGEYNDADAGGTTRSIANSIKMPSTFFLTYNDTYKNWCNISYFNNYWNAVITTLDENSDSQATAIKTIYDPSPVGFMVPCSLFGTGATISGTNQTASRANIIGSWNGGFTIKRNSSDTVGSFFPANGQRQRATGNYFGANTYGRYWVYSRASQDKARFWYIDNGLVYPQYTIATSLGNNIRPTVELT